MVASRKRYPADNKGATVARSLALLGLPAPCVIFRYLRSAPIFLGLLQGLLSHSTTLATFSVLL